jgi:large subunit ribosomal protein L21
MYAVVKTGGKQYAVKPGDVLKIEKIPGGVGESVSLGRVLLLRGDDAPVLGCDTLAAASVHAEILEQTRDEKIIVFKKKRRHNYRRRNGHRQYVTVVRITDILQQGEPQVRAKTTSKAVKKVTASEKDVVKTEPSVDSTKEPASKTAAKAGKPARIANKPKE